MPLDTHLQQQCCPVARIRKSVIFWPAAKQLPIENALELQCGVCPPQFVRLSTITGLNYWTELLDWTTGLISFTTNSYLV